MGRPVSSDLLFVDRACSLAADEAKELGFHPRVFCQLALPYKDPGEQPFWERRNGDFTLTVRPAIETTDDGRRELVEHPVPVSVEALRLLQGSPLALDIYTWLTHRNSYARQRTKITWLQLQGQFGSTTATDTWRGRAKFRETFLRQLPYVLQVYPEARVDVTAEGLVVWPSRTHIRQKSRRMDKDA